MEIVILTPSEWIPTTIIASIGTMTTFSILIKERAKRKLSSTTFITKYLEYTSYGCIIAGFISSFALLLLPFNGFCFFVGFVHVFIFSTQATLMGFYQLSRLYYCFSKTQVYSNKGYSSWVFILMVIIGILLLINWPLANLFSGVLILKSKCGIDKHGQFYYISHKKLVFEGAFIWPGLVIISYLSWDVLTLILYVSKIISFKRYKEINLVIYKRILFILYKIVILTLFYEVISLSAGIILMLLVTMTSDDIVHIGILVLGNIVNAVFSYAMYLMMEHNVKEYTGFLKMVKRVKLDVLCCKHMVNNQLHELTSAVIENETAERDSKKEVSFQTDNISTMYKCKKTGMELSVETAIYWDYHICNNYYIFQHC